MKIKNLHHRGELGLIPEDEIIADNQPKCIYEIKKEGFNIKATF